MTDEADKQSPEPRKTGFHNSDFGCRWCGIIIFDEDLPEQWPEVCPECGKG